MAPPLAGPGSRPVGGLTLDRAREVAETGVDFLAVGALTHSVIALDIALDLSDRLTLRSHPEGTPMDRR